MWSLDGLSTLFGASVRHRLIGSAAAIGLGVVAAAGLGVAPAAAADPTFTFTGGNTPTVGPAGNTMGFTSAPGGLGVTVSAYSAPSGTGPLQKSYLGDYSLGLGVTNNVTTTRSGSTTTDDSHTVDNSGWVDYVVFQFSTPLSASAVSLSAFGDTDIQVWTGNFPAGYNFTGTDLSNTALFTNKGVFLGGTSDRTVSFMNFAAATTLIVGASPSDRQGDDFFKIASLSVKATPGPIAGAGLPVLGLLGLLGLGLRGRRRA